MGLAKATGFLTDKTRKLEALLNEKSLRERTLLLICFLGAIFFIWRSIVFDYILTSTEQLSENKQRMVSQITRLEGQIDSMSEAIGRDPTSALVDRLKQVTKENDEVQIKIENYTNNLTQAKEMINILQGILSENHNIRIVQMENMADKPILPKDSSIQVYDKGISLEFESTYSDTVAFLQHIEQHQVKILWDDLTYEVTKYPLAKIKITMHTMSTEVGWLNV